MPARNHSASREVLALLDQSLLTCQQDATSPLWPLRNPTITIGPGDCRLRTQAPARCREHRAGPSPRQSPAIQAPCSTGTRRSPRTMGSLPTAPHTQHTRSTTNYTPSCARTSVAAGQHQPARGAPRKAGSQLPAAHQDGRTLVARPLCMRPPPSLAGRTSSRAGVDQRSPAPDHPRPEESLPSAGKAPGPCRARRTTSANRDPSERFASSFSGYGTSK
jgi:hypothetical protein